MNPLSDTFESVVERRIREAMERGEFDDLPGAGEPIPGAAEPYDPLWWVKSWIERERLADESRETVETAGRGTRAEADEVADGG